MAQVSEIKIVSAFLDRQSTQFMPRTRRFYITGNIPSTSILRNPEEIYKHHKHCRAQGSVMIFHINATTSSTAMKRLRHTMIALHGPPIAAPLSMGLN
jgi:hypothetical protein